MIDRTGEQLANYRLIRLLGSGSFAEVYLAEHLYLRTQVALKTLKTPLTYDARESFLTEARTIAHLLHPHIVRVLDFGIQGETPFLVMDYAPGGTLRKRHPKGTRLSLPTVVGYVRQIAGALHYAHQQKLIHRDIKPENVLVGRNNELLISDFGIALLVHSSLSQSTQQVIGTVAYMAPEQLQGKPRPASDQYALAVMVYEWLCGERLFDGTWTEIATQQVLAPPPPLREKVPDIPLAVEQAIMTALAKDPKQRFGTIQGFANALEEASRPVSVSGEIPAGETIPQLPGLQVSLGEISTTGASQASMRGKDDGRLLSLDEKTGVKFHEEKRKLWGIGKRQAWPLMLGVILSALLSNFIILIHPHPLHGIELLWLFPMLVIPLFFGVLYGPLAGLVTGGLGYFLGTSLIKIGPWITPPSATIGLLPLWAIKPPWYFALAFLLIGFIAGFATFFTQGEYQNIRQIVLAELFVIPGLLCGFFAIFNPLWPHLYAYETLGVDFTHIALPNMLLVLLLLPPLLILRNYVGTGKISRLWKR
jgi:serine/threonine protein kinase